MNKAQWFWAGMIWAMILVCVSAMVRYPVGRPVPSEIYTAASDPCDPALRFLVPTDPNWSRDFGDNERTRLIWNVSVNRGISQRNMQVLAEVSRRLLVLESLHDPNDPNEVKE